eukprot:scaffold2238_cov145-Skeletonema_menzelii.AAC.2
MDEDEASSSDDGQRRCNYVHCYGVIDTDTQLCKSCNKGYGLSWNSCLNYVPPAKGKDAAERPSKVSISPNLQPSTLSIDDVSSATTPLTMLSMSSTNTSTANSAAVTTPTAKSWPPPPNRPNHHNISDLLGKDDNHVSRKNLFIANLPTETSVATLGAISSNATEASRIKLKTYQASKEFLTKLIKTTIGALQKHNKSYTTGNEEERRTINNLTSLFHTANNFIHGKKKELCEKDNDSGDWEIAAKEMTEEIYESTGNYLLQIQGKNKVGCNVLKTKGMGERGLEQLLDNEEIRNELESTDAEDAVVKKYVKVLRTTQDNLSFAKRHPEFQKIVGDIMMTSRSHHCHPDHIPQNFHETVDFVFEMFLGCSLEGCSPVFVMERYLCLGSETVRRHIRLPKNENMDNKKAIALLHVLISLLKLKSSYKKSGAKGPYRTRTILLACHSVMSGVLLLIVGQRRDELVS